MYATLEESPALATARALGEDGATDIASLRALEDAVCSEAGIWAPDAARRAIAQASGDVPRAVGLVRVWAAALPALYAETVRDDDVHVTKRLSSAYPEVPGGQWLGASPELASRLLRWEDDDSTTTAPLPEPAVHAEPRPPTRAELPRARTMLPETAVLRAADDGPGDDPATAALEAPHRRATRLAITARGETGALVALAALALNRRREAVIVELSAGTAGVRIPHPRTGEPCRVVDIPFVEAETVVDADVDGRVGLAIGWGASLGSVDRRALAIALLDAARQADGDDAAPFRLDDDTVLAAVDGSATSGFVEHLRLPHYASFASYIAQAQR